MTPYTREFGCIYVISFNDCFFIAGADGCDDGGEGKAGVGDSGVAELLFIGATLHLRGAELVVQPLVSPSGSILVYNGNFLSMMGSHKFLSYSDIY